MNILYHHRTQGSGVEGVHIRGIVDAFRQLGHKVTLVSPPGIDPYICSKTESGPSGLSRAWKMFAKNAPEIIFELSEVLYNFWAYNRMAALARKEKFDFIYERYALNTFAGLDISRKYKIPLILEVNDSALIERVRKLKVTGLAKTNERKVFEGAFAIVTISSYFKKVIVESGVRAKKIFVIPNAVDEAKFPIDNDSNLEIRREYSLEDKMVIGYVGSFLQWHGVDLLLESFEAAIKSRPDARLLLIGDGPTFGAIRKRVEGNGLKDFIIFTGKVSHEKVASYIQAMDICVIPDSNAYGSPMKLFEYMASGKAVVAPRLLPMEDVIKNGDNGILFDPGSKSALSASLELLINDNTARNRIGRSARTAVLGNHTWIKNASTVLDIYRGSRWN